MGESHSRRRYHGSMNRKGSSIVCKRDRNRSVFPITTRTAISIAAIQNGLMLMGKTDGHRHRRRSRACGRIPYRWPQSNRGACWAAWAVIHTVTFWISGAASAEQHVSSPTDTDVRLPALISRAITSRPATFFANGSDSATAYQLQHANALVDPLSRPIVYCGLYAACRHEHRGQSETLFAGVARVCAQARVSAFTMSCARAMVSSTILSLGLPTHDVKCDRRAATISGMRSQSAGFEDSFGARIAATVALRLLRISSASKMSAADRPAPLGLHTLMGDEAARPGAEHDTKTSLSAGSRHSR